MKKSLAVLVSGLGCVVFIYLWNSFTPSKHEPVAEERSVTSVSKPRPKIQVNPGDQQERALAILPTVEVIEGETPQEVADNYLKKHRETFNIQPFHAPRSEVFRSPIGSKVRYTFTQSGLPIIGMEIQIRMDSNLVVEKVTNNYRPLKKVDLESLDSLSQETMREIAESNQYEEDLGGAKREYNRVLVPVSGSDTPEVAFVAPVKERLPGNRTRPVQLLLRASDGQVLKKSFSRAEF